MSSLIFVFVCCFLSSWEWYFKAIPPHIYIPTHPTIIGLPISCRPANFCFLIFESMLIMHANLELLYYPGRFLSLWNIFLFCGKSSWLEVYMSPNISMMKTAFLQFTSACIWFFLMEHILKMKFSILSSVSWTIIISDLKLFA